MKITQRIATLIWVMLSQEARAPESDPNGFVDHVVRNDTGEFRLYGQELGFGGKFYWTEDEWCVRCYKEDISIKNGQIITRINQRLNDMRVAYQIGLDDGTNGTGRVRFETLRRKRQGN